MTVAGSLALIPGRISLQANEDIAAKVASNDGSGGPVVWISIPADDAYTIRCYL